jgi:hypothetical protein
MQRRSPDFNEPNLSRNLALRDALLWPNLARRLREPIEPVKLFPPVLSEAAAHAGMYAAERFALNGGPSDWCAHANLRRTRRSKLRSGAGRRQVSARLRPWKVEWPCAAQRWSLERCVCSFQRRFENLVLARFSPQADSPASISVNGDSALMP